MLSAVLLCSSISADAEADAAADEVAARTAALCRGLAVLLACTVGLSSATVTGPCDVSHVVVPCRASQDNFMNRRPRCSMNVGLPFFNHVKWCAQSWQVRYTELLLRPARVLCCCSQHTSMVVSVVFGVGLLLWEPGRVHGPVDSVSASVTMTSRSRTAVGLPHQSQDKTTPHMKTNK